MGLTIGAKPDHGFDEPLGLLTDCHRRIERFLGQLLTVAEAARGGELAAEQREALDVALRYFREAAPLHTADEEASLFPRLRDVDSDAARAALAALAELEADHNAADIAHAEIDRLGARWLADGRLPADDAQRLADLLRGLQATYARHIAVEDQQVFPLAGQLLEAGSLTEVGREMAVRRGLDPDHLPPVSRCVARREARGK
jgi:hemerythrin-like domain-containing protein